MKSINGVAILGIFTTVLLVIMMLFTLESSPGIKEKLGVAQQIKFDYNLNFISISQDQEECRVLIVEQIDKQDDIKARIQEIGDYMWRKYSFELGFTSLHIAYQGQIGSGCYQDTVSMKTKIKNPLKNMPQIKWK